MKNHRSTQSKKVKFHRTWKSANH